MFLTPQANFTISVKAVKGPTPSQTSHPSRPSFDVEQKDVQQRLQYSPLNYQKAKSLVSKIRIRMKLLF
jgi:hypothetical protein